jgi:hypothetical protein
MNSINIPLTRRRVCMHQHECSCDLIHLVISRLILRYGIFFRTEYYPDHFCGHLSLVRQHGGSSSQPIRPARTGRKRTTFISIASLLLSSFGRSLICRTYAHSMREGFNTMCQDTCYFSVPCLRQCEVPNTNSAYTRLFGLEASLRAAVRFIPG